MKNFIVLFVLAIAACSSSTGSKSGEEKEDPTIIITSGDCDGEMNDGNEVCDGKNLGDETCESQGFGPGELKCAATCQAFDVTSCGAPESCGDNVIDEGEACDGADVGEDTCVSLGYGEGVLGCAANCSGYELGECGAPETCGNGVVDGDEVCDGEDLAGVTCASLDLGDGAISCDENCLGLDTSICEVPLVCEPECPGELTCERGVCVGPLSDLILNEVGFNVSGRIEVEGQKPIFGAASVCNNGNDGYETASVTFTEATKGYTDSVSIKCGDDFKFQTRLPEGTYEVRVRRENHSNTQTNLFNVRYLAETALVIDKDINNAIFNEVGFNVSGKIQVEGQTPSYAASSVCNNGNDGYETASVTFTEETKGYTDSVSVKCGDNFDFQTRLPKGTYEVRVRRENHNNTQTNLFNVRYLAESALVIDKNISNAVFNEVGFNVSGKIQVGGLTPSYGASSVCNNGNDGYETASVTFTEETKGYTDSVSVKCGDNFDFQTRLPEGTYEVRVRRENHNNTQTNLFNVRYLAESALVIDKNIRNAVFNEVGFTVMGKIQVEGQTPSYAASSVCNNGNDGYETASVTFTEEAKGYSDSVSVKCGDNFEFQTRLPQGTYEVRVRRENHNNTQTNLFNVRYLAETALVIDKTIRNAVFNEVGFDVSGKIQVEGQTPTYAASSVCNNGNDGYETASVTFTEETKGYTDSVSVKCGDDFNFQTRLPLGRYEVRVRRENHNNTQTNLFNVRYLAEKALVIDKNINNAIFNEVGFDVVGKIQVEGQTPIYAASSVCNNGNDGYETASVTFTEKAKGYTDTVSIKCGDNFDFQTRLPTGIYEVRVRRENHNNTQTNLFNVRYLAIDKLRVDAN